MGIELTRLRYFFDGSLEFYAHSECCAQAVPGFMSRTERRLFFRPDPYAMVDLARGQLELEEQEWQ